MMMWRVFLLSLLFYSGSKSFFWNSTNPKISLHLSKSLLHANRTDHTKKYLFDINLLTEVGTMVSYTWCTSVNDAPIVLGCTAMTMLAMALAMGHFGSGWPLSELGRRPIGYGLFSYLWNSRSVGVFGYDTILGAFSPPIRLGVHIACLWGLWATASSVVLPGVLEFISSTIDSDILTYSENADCISVIVTGVLSLVLYLYFFYALDKYTQAVSDPGGPREHKIQRKPKWFDKNVVIENFNQNWRCVVAEDAHEVTENRFMEEKELTGNIALTGEPAGRQIWTSSIETTTAHTTTKDQHDDKQKNYDESLVQEMASGGRRYKGFNPAVNPNSADRIFRAQQIRDYIAAGNEPPKLNKWPKTPSEAAKKGAHFYSMLLTKDGHWAGDYGGPHFLLPGLVIAWYIMGQPEMMLDKEQCALIKHYMITHQQADGGWGMHIESPSTMFGTTMIYVALRLLGVGIDNIVIQRSRAYIKYEGGAIKTASWAKFYLCLLGCMEWEGHNSVPPEMWLLPNWCPFHPGRMWCHARMVYLPMGYLYGSRFVYPQAETDPLISSLRQELYCTPYKSIPWIKTRHMVADTDNYSHIPLIMKIAQNCLARYESWSIFQSFREWVREKGLKFSIDYMAAEDLQTNFIDIGPVNKVFNMISAFHHVDYNLDDPKVVKHMMRIPDYLWVAEDGMKMQGYNGSQAWDTSFAVQAFHESNLLDEFPHVAKSVYKYLERTQILSTHTSQSSPAFEYEADVFRNKYFRHVSQGGWPFSTSAHGWPISDCTGEGLKGVMCLMECDTVRNAIQTKEIPALGEERLGNAINVILTLQNEDGGWATYENNRGYRWYEQLNPSEVFGDIMIDYSYVECSMASLSGLSKFHATYPKHRTKEVQFAIARGREFVKSIQRSDGSWYGSWACCFCYGCWFGIEGLIRAGESKDCPEIKKCCEFLLKHQRPNGGWGEDFTSCYDKDYAANGMEAYGDRGSGVVNTAWALMALSVAEYPNVDAIKKGVRYLMNRQLPSGDWPQEGVAGVFNRACGITYTAYRNVFPIWALGRCAATYGEEALGFTSK